MLPPEQDFSATAQDIDRAPVAPPVQEKGPVSFEEYHRVLLALREMTDARAELQDEVWRLERKIKTAEKLDGLIEPYARRTFRFMCIYCGFVGAVMIWDGLALWNFDIEDGVLEFLVGSTAATVLGLVGMVLTGIFVGARRNR